MFVEKLFSCLDIPDGGIGGVEGSLGGVHPLQQCPSSAGEELHAHGILQPPAPLCRLVLKHLPTCLHILNLFFNVFSFGREALDDIGAKLGDLANLVLDGRQLPLQALVFAL